MNLRALKYFCAVPPAYGLNIPAEEYTSSGIRLLRTTDVGSGGHLKPGISGVFVDPEQVSAEYMLRDGDLLLSRSGTLGRCLLFRETSGPTTHAGYLVRFRPAEGIVPSYLAYCAQSNLMRDAIAAEAIESTIGNFNAEKYANVRLPWWPPATQRAIADYLDRETARIDALIVAKRQTVELLEERLAVATRQALLSGDHPMLPLKRTWRIVDCKHRTPAYVATGYPVISPGDATPGRLDLSRAHRFVDEADYRDLTSAGRNPTKGDIIYSRNASIGIAAFVDTKQPFCMGQDVCLISSDQASQLYLTYCLNTLGRDQLEKQKIGSTFSRVNISQILELLVPTPAPEDQYRIAQQLDESARLHQMVVSRLEGQIVLLEERRRSLIAAAVSGQVKVPEQA